MNLLARNVAVPFSDRCATVTGDFSKTAFNKAFAGKIDENDFVTVEKFIPGTFQKHVNNDRKFVNGVCRDFADGLKKAKAFVHDTYKMSKGNLKLVSAILIKFLFFHQMIVLQKL